MVNLMSAPKLKSGRRKAKKKRKGGRENDKETKKN